MIWPWARIIELEGSLNLYQRELGEVREEWRLAGMERDQERARRIGAEALAAERKEECQRLREDLAAARQAERESRELMAKTLVEANVRLTSPLQDKPPDMAKIREMRALQDPAEQIRSKRQFETLIMRNVLTKLQYPGFGPNPSQAPVVAEENPPGEGERPSLNAVG